MSAEVTSMTGKSSTRSRWMLIPPPLLFALPLVLGNLLNRVAPLPLLPGALAGFAPWLGAVLLVLWALLFGSCLRLFVQARTTIIPHGRANALVTSGPYRLTRNPMYISLILACLGLTAFANTLWPVLFLLLPLWVLQMKVIPFEEQTMTSVFGSQYTAYSAQVRRWL